MHSNAHSRHSACLRQLTWGKDLLRLGYTLSLDMRIQHEDGEGVSLGDLRVDMQPLEDEQLMNQERSQYIIDVMKQALSPRERYVLVRRFWHDETLDIIGCRLGVCRERIRQLQNSALKKLKNRIER